MRHNTRNAQWRAKFPLLYFFMYKFSLRANSLLARSHARVTRAFSRCSACLARHSRCRCSWHRHLRDSWNKTEHYTHSTHLIPKRKACLQATVTKRRLSCCSFSYYGCLPFFCELSCLNAQLKHLFPYFFFQLEASFTANVAAIEANCARVEARMNALLEKFETKGR